MYCSSCGSQIPQGARNCPNCGMPAYSPSAPAVQPGHNQQGPSPLYDPTVPVSSSNAPYPQPVQGVDPYSPSLAPQQQEYPPPPPYDSSWSGIPPVSPPPQQRHRSPVGIIVLVLALAILLIGGGGLLYYNGVSQANRQHAQATATAQTQGTAQARINATATAQAQNPYTHSGTLALVDPLSDNSKGHGWDENTNCAFVGGTYHAIAPNPNYSDYCIATNTAYTNLALEVQMQITKGDAGGLLFRVGNTDQVDKYYDFYVGQDGSYSLDITNGSNSRTLKQGSSAAVHQGINQSNLLAVVAQGNTLSIYVNHQPLGSVTNNTYSQGKIGLYAGVYNRATEVAFSNLRVWSL